jgi:diadenosine tetraphosphate (Ap4A) HIT family hydrolase
MSTSAWSNPRMWRELKKPESCPICRKGTPLDVLADYPATWVTGGAEVPLPGYACVVSKHHVVEPFELPASDAMAFWHDVMAAARALNQLFNPAKLNYEIHGNTIPHLHLHLFPRFAGDPYVGGPIDPRQVRFTRTPEDLDHLRRALAEALDRDARTTG